MTVKKFHIAYITDDNYAMPTCISIVSLIKNKLPDVSYVIHIIADNVSTQNAERFKELSCPNCEIDIIDADNAFYQEVKEIKSEINAHVTITALLKFNLPNILKDVNILLYIDGDTLITQDISELFDIDMSNFSIAAVDNSQANRFPTLRKYFNNGVMLLNLNRMRQNHITEKLFEYRKNGLNYYMDQDAFNVVLKDETFFLPMMYNFRVPGFIETNFNEFNEKYCSNKYKDEYDCLKSQKILHTTSSLKFWKYWLPWISDIFIENYKISPYKNEPVKLKSPLPVIINKIESINSKINTKKEWRFPRDKVPKGSKIVLYGAGEVGRDFWQWLKDTGYCKAVLWVDKNYQAINQEMNELNLVHSPEEIKNCQSYDYVLISIFNIKVLKIVLSYLKNMDISEDKIITI